MCVGKAAHVCGFSVLVTVWVAPLPPTQDNKEDEHSQGHGSRQHALCINWCHLTEEYDILCKCRMHKYS